MRQHAQPHACHRPAHALAQPTSVTASPGDTIDFKFHENMEHNVIVAQGSDASTACAPKEGALHSALQNDGATVSVPVNSTDPVYML